MFRLSRMRTRVFWAVYAIIIVSSIELVSYAGLVYLKSSRNLVYRPIDSLTENQKKIVKRIIKDESSYFKYSPSLGWTIKGNGETDLYKSNSSGLRAYKEYNLKPSPDRLRIATFGDSFTHGDEIGNSDTWQSKLEHLDNKLEVMNFGVPGYGLDQAYLRYLEDGVQYQPDIVFIGYMTDDIYRNVNTFRLYKSRNTEFPFTKPRFIIENDNLTIISNPISTLEDYNHLLNGSRKIMDEIGANDYYYGHHYKSNTFDFSPTFRLIVLVMQHIFEDRSNDSDTFFDESSEAFEVTARIFDSFHADVINVGSVPVIVVFPSYEDIERYQKNKTLKYMRLRSYLDSRGYETVDLIEAFKGVGVEYELNDLFVPSLGHYTPYANEIVANYLYDYLDHHGLLK